MGKARYTVEWVIEFDEQQLIDRFPEEYRNAIDQGMTTEDFIKETVGELWSEPAMGDHLREGLLVGHDEYESTEWELDL